MCTMREVRRSTMMRQGVAPYTYCEPVVQCSDLFVVRLGPLLPIDPMRGPKDALRTMHHPTRFPKEGAARSALRKNHSQGLSKEPKKTGAKEYYRTYENCENR